MKILYSCLSESWGGMEMFTLTAILKLKERNFDAIFLCLENSRLHKEALKRDIKCITLSKFSYFSISSILKVGKTIKALNIDLIHTQSSKDLWILSPALYINRKEIPLFLTKQVGSYIVKKDVLHKTIYKKVSAVFAISNVIAQNILDTAPVKKEQVKLLFNGIDTNKFNPDKVDKLTVRNEFSISDDTIVIGMLARFSWGKGHEEFLQAAKLLLEKYKNITFMIVGEPSKGEDEYAKKIYNMAAELEIKKNIIFTGFRSDIPEVLASMDIFAFPSHSEAFGIALAEAQSLGVPSVGANSDGVLDIIVNNETGLHFENKNHYDLYLKLETLILDKNLRKSFSQKAREMAVKKFDLDMLTDKVIQYYDEFLSKGKK